MIGGRTAASDGPPWLPLYNLAGVPAHDEGAESGCFVVLARRKDTSKLVEMLRRMEAYARPVHVTEPLLVFHDDLAAADAHLLAAATPSSPMHLHRIAMCLPTRYGDVPDRVHGSTVSYRHMVRFFAVQLWSHPALRQHRCSHVMRLDTDSFLIAPLPQNVFHAMMRPPAVRYAAVMVFRDSAELSAGLHEVVQTYLAGNVTGVTPSRMRGLVYRKQAALQTGWSQLDVTGVQFWNNLEVVDLRGFAWLPAHVQWLRVVDTAGVIYRYRTGDALLRTVAALLMLSTDEVALLTRLVPYQHQDYFSCPADTPKTPHGELPHDRSVCNVTSDLQWIGDKCHTRIGGPADGPTAGPERCALHRRQPCHASSGETSEERALCDGTRVLT